ncbi:MAG: peptidoglycan DD-metalloendopeptidase family protein [Pseudomonadota bacterium]
MAASGRHGKGRILTTIAVLVALVGCTDGVGGFDFDLRDLGDGFDTSEAVTNLPDRPAPDNRGVISYPNYQVALAQQGDTATTVAARLGLDANELARFNGIEVDAPLRAEEVLALPARVAEPSPATGAATTGPIQTVDVTGIATTALDRVESGGSPAATPTSPADAVAEPVRYRVGRGDTAFSIARQFNVPVSTIAAWNTLDANLTVREGQFLLIPQSAAPAPATTVADTPAADPGTGSATPLPPSAATPLPEDTTTEVPETPEAPDLGTPPPASAQADTAQLLRPVGGTVIREYAPGRNEGIDIGVPAGTEVKAADAGTVAAVTTDTNGTDIVVIRHADNLLTVYTGVSNLVVGKDDTVGRGDVIAQVAARDPSFLHFEVRRGLDSLDPADFLP